MGVPRLFRLLCERYPCILQQHTETSAPQFDNLYLDFNGVIHTSTHNNSEGYDKTIEEMMLVISRPSHPPLCISRLVFSHTQKQQCFFTPVIASMCAHSKLLERFIDLRYPPRNSRVHFPIHIAGHFWGAGRARSTGQTSTPSVHLCRRSCTTS